LLVTTPTRAEKLYVQVQTLEQAGKLRIY